MISRNVASQPLNESENINEFHPFNGRELVIANTVKFLIVEFSTVNYWKKKLDVDSQSSDDASPMLSYRFIFRPTWMLISALHHKSKFNFEHFWKKSSCWVSML